MSEKTIKVAVRAVKAHISKSILPTYGRFSCARSHIISMKLIEFLPEGDDYLQVQFSGFVFLYI